MRQQEYIQRLKSGDSTVMNDIYRDYGKALLGVALQIVGEQNQALDVLQDALVNIWQNGARYDSSKGRLYTWMLNIVRNKAIDHKRSTDRRGKIQSSVDDVHITDSGYEFNTDVIGLNKELAALDSDKRELIEMSFILGYSHREIAEKKELPIGTVKTRIRSAIGELKKVFG